VQLCAFYLIAAEVLAWHLSEQPPDLLLQSIFYASGSQIFFHITPLTNPNTVNSSPTKITRSNDKNFTLPIVKEQ